MLKVSSAIGALKRVRRFIFNQTAFQVYKALIMLIFITEAPSGTVWVVTWVISSKNYNRAARVITKSPFDTSSNRLLSTLDWERLSVRRKKPKATEAFDSRCFIVITEASSLSHYFLLLIALSGCKFHKIFLFQCYFPHTCRFETGSNPEPKKRN